MRYSEIIERRFGQRDLAQAPTYSDTITIGFEFEVEYDHDPEDWELDQYMEMVFDSENEPEDAFSSLFGTTAPSPLEEYSWCDEDGGDTDGDVSFCVKVDETDQVIDLRDCTYSEFISIFDSSNGYDDYMRSSYNESRRSGDAVEEMNDILDNEEENWPVSVVADQSLHYGAEMVTPPLPPAEAFELFDKIVSLIDDHPSLKTTNDCGLHVNIGTFDIENFDILKFMMFFDEKYINRVFPARNLTSKLGRMLMNIINKTGSAGDYREFNTALLGQLQGDRHYSVNFTYLPKKKYIEVRAPGGTGYETRGSEIRDMVSRVYRCIELAMDRTAYRNEYAKKLSKFMDKNGELDNSNDTDFTKRLAELAKQWIGRPQRVRCASIHDMIYAIYALASHHNFDIPVKLIPSFRQTAADVFAALGEGAAYSRVSKKQYTALCEKLKSTPRAAGLIMTLVNQYVKTTTDNTRLDM